MTVLAVSSCKIRFEKQGKKITKEVKIKPFEQLYAGGGISIEYTKGDHYSLTVEGNETEIKHLNVKQTGDKLYLTASDSEKNTIHIGCRSYFVLKLVAPSINSIQLEAGCSFQTESELRADSMNIVTESGSLLNLYTLRCKKVQCETSSGSLANIMQLTAEDISIETSSGSSFTSTLSNCGHVKANASSGSSIELKGNARSIEQDEDSGASISIQNLKTNK